jgi:hypothetical protein
MSRVDDLIALVQSANDAYLVNPSRNARMAYIQIDDICELAIKSWLQAHVQNWTPVSHQHNGRDYYKGFPTIINEVRNATPGNQALHALLNRFEDRREKRNHFFHNQDLSGLTVTEEECVRAFCDLYDLLEMLYGNDFVTGLESNRIARAQIVIIRLKREGYETQWVYDLFRQYISSAITLQPGSLGHEYRAIYDDPQGLVDRIRSSLESLINENQAEINYINGLQRPKQDHRQKRAELQRRNQRLQEILNHCFSP